MEPEVLSGIITNAVTQALEAQSKLFQEQLKLVANERDSDKSSSYTLKPIKFATFDEHSETFVSFIQRLKNYLEMNNIDFEDPQQNKASVQVLISCLPAKLYQTLASLTTPNLPKDKTFSELCTLLQDYLCPRPNEIAKQ